MEGIVTVPKSRVSSNQRIEKHASVSYFPVDIAFLTNTPAQVESLLDIMEQAERRIGLHANS